MGIDQIQLLIAVMLGFGQVCLAISLFLLIKAHGRLQKQVYALEDAEIRRQLPEDWL